MVEKLIDLELCKTCPEDYPWPCGACQRENTGCLGRLKKPKEEPEESEE